MGNLYCIKHVATLKMFATSHFSHICSGKMLAVRDHALHSYNSSRPADCVAIFVDFTKIACAKSLSNLVSSASVA